jgi:hypothetical protein
VPYRVTIDCQIEAKQLRAGQVVTPDIDISSDACRTLLRAGWLEPLQTTDQIKLSDSAAGR